MGRIPSIQSPEGDDLRDANARGRMASLRDESGRLIEGLADVVNHGARREIQNLFSTPFLARPSRRRAVGFVISQSADLGEAEMSTPCSVIAAIHVEIVPSATFRVGAQTPFKHNIRTSPVVRIE